MHPENTNLFIGCGSQFTAPKSIYYWKITNEGQTLFSRQYKVSGTGDTKCRGVTFDYSKGQGALLVTSPADAYKTVNTYAKDGTAGSSDTYIWLISENG